MFGAATLGSECSQWGFPNDVINSNSSDELEQIYKSVECPVCHEFPTVGEVYSCKRKLHMICEQCIPLSKTCPACSAPILKEESTILDHCIDNFLIPCRYKFEGCPYIIRGVNLREHLRSCTYRPIACIMAKCDEIVPFKQLFEHLITVHARKVNGIKDSNKHVIEWWIEGDILSTARWPPFYFTCFNNVFLYMCVSTIHGMWEWVWILASDEEALRFRVEAKMENLDKIMGLEWRGPVHSIKKSVKEIISSGLVFVTNSKEIRNPFLFQKGNDGKCFWRTEVHLYQVSPAIPTSIPYLITNDVGKNHITKAKDSSIYSIVSSTDTNAAQNQVQINSNKIHAKEWPKQQIVEVDPVLKPTQAISLAANLGDNKIYSNEVLPFRPYKQSDHLKNTQTKLAADIQSDYSLRFDGKVLGVSVPERDPRLDFKSDYSLRFDDDGSNSERQLEFFNKATDTTEDPKQTTSKPNDSDVSRTKYVTPTVKRNSKDPDTAFPGDSF